MKLRKVAQRFLLPSFVVTVIYLLKYSCKISPRAEVELSPNLRIGNGTQVSSFVKIKATDGELSIGRDVSIGASCFISADAGGVRIGDHTMLGPNSCIIGNDYRYDRLDIPVAHQPKTSKGITIGKDVWIGAGCIVMDGAVIEDHCIVTPHSVVTGKLASGSVAQGNPARVIFVRRP